MKHQTLLAVVLPLAGLGAAVRAIIRVIAWQKSLSAGDPPAQPMPDDDQPGGHDDRHA